MGSRGLIERGSYYLSSPKRGGLSEGGGLFERGELNRGFKVFALFNSQARIITYLVVHFFLLPLWALV